MKRALATLLAVAASVAGGASARPGVETANLTVFFPSAKISP